MHPRASYKDYLNQRREILSKYKQELYLSDLSVAYNLKNF